MVINRTNERTRIEALYDPTIGELLKRQAPFHVPKYQRDFSWEDDEINDFVVDLNNLVSSFTSDMMIGEPAKRHFMGGIVCANDYDSKYDRTYWLIDGQQRLATITFALNLISQELKNQANNNSLDEKNQKNALKESNRIFKNFIYRDPESDDNESEDEGESELTHILRLELSKADNNFFKGLLLGNEVSSVRASHDRMISAQNIIKKGIIEKIQNENEPSEQLEILKIYVRCILSDFYVILIVCADKNQAYRIFSTLNNRGRSLSDGDLLRSHSLELIDKFEEYQTEVESFWSDILSDSPTEIDKFLRFYYASKLGVRGPKNGLSDYYEKKIFIHQQMPLTKKKDSFDIRNKVENLFTESQIYQNFLADGNWPYENSSLTLWDQQRLERLIVILDHVLCMPLLLSARSHLEEKEFSEIINILEPFVFRYKTICNARVQELSSVYNVFAKKIRDGNFDIKAFKLKLKDLNNRDADNSTFKNNLSKFIYKKSGNKKNKQILYFLSTLEDYHKWYQDGGIRKPKPQYDSIWDLKYLDIEHIYPQDPSYEIPKLNNYKNDLGNLTFLAQGENRSLKIGNQPFKKKKIEYKKSKVKLTKELASLEDWDLNRLKKRREKLMDMALKVFKI